MLYWITKVLLIRHPSASVINRKCYYTVITRGVAIVTTRVAMVTKRVAMLTTRVAMVTTRVVMVTIRVATCVTI